MNQREPVLLTVLVETAKRRWFVAGITLDGQPVPLMCSAEDNLAPYVGVVRDEQVSFLRHRLAGVLQRGVDRLWGRSMKARQVVFVTDADFDSTAPELTQQVADHFVLWLTQPPVVFFLSENGFCESAAPVCKQLAGDLDPADGQILAEGLPRLVSVLHDSDLWELARNKPAQ